ncbi:ycf49 isoform X1 [Chlorella sorokiniana]|uniref:Ycf49 isoform X1 n=1 Tax=Chlorella sorokiniana TaxID=3076 RepID=A0A2P6TPY2_CHLSO|nr:ycf49 isoform X1 [Chlorella sorokiniana]|eukprot:PRW56088.1 ycf49 isoform X1 [Chlorella sorokiniana]
MALSASLQPCTAPAALRRGPWVRLRPAAGTPLAAAPRRERRLATALPPSAQQQQEEQQRERQQQAAGGSDPAPSSSSSSSKPLLAAAAGVAAAAAFTVVGSPVAGAQLALELHAEPANALSLPTWMVHVSSVVEWIVAMGLIWRYGEVSGNPRWKGLSWGMLPCLGSAMCACTWHFFYNSPELQFLVALQAFLTVVGNCTCWWAAYRIYQWSEQESGTA